MLTSPKLAGSFKTGLDFVYNEENFVFFSEGTYARLQSLGLILRSKAAYHGAVHDFLRHFMRLGRLQ
jgi:hypothetical protein